MAAATACLTLVLLAPPAPPAPAPGRTPEAVAATYFQSVKAGDWPAVAGQFTPAAQAKFRALMAELVEGAAEADQAGVRAMLLGPGTTAEQFAQLSDRDFVARALESILARALGMVKFQRLDVVGTVAEGPDVSHVVCRMQLAGPGGVTVEKMTVVTLERDAGGWGLALSGDIKGLAAALKAQLPPKPKS